jgi:hypothetical protein
VINGWHAPPGKETMSSTLRLTANSITLPNGACPAPTPRPDRQAPNQPRCPNPSHTRPQEPLTVTTTPIELVDPPINGTSPLSLADMRCQPRLSDGMSRTEKLVVAETCMMGMTPTRAMGRADRLA